MASGLALVAILWVACSGADRIETPGGFSPSEDVTLDVDWRIDLVDTGFFAYAPRELSRVAMSPDGATAYVGTSDGRFVAVDAIRAQVRWAVDVGESIDGEPAATDGAVYVGSSQGTMYAVDPADGRVIWTYDAGGNLDSTPAISGDRLVFANGAGTIVCLDRQTGQLLWTHTDEAPILDVRRGLHPPIKGQASPLVREDRVFVGFPNGRISQLDLETGAPRWTTDLAGDELRHTDVDEPPVLADGRLLASSFSGGLYALEPATGAVIWRQPLRGATRPAIFGNQVLTTTSDGNFHSLNLSDGQIRFSLRLDDRAPERVHLLGSYAIVPTSQGALYVLDAAAPFIHARFDPDEGFASVALSPASRVIAFDNQGVLFGLTVRQR